MENEEPQYEYVTKVRCYSCNGAEEKKQITPKVKKKKKKKKAMNRK
jgi:uncharacterized protein YjhX (UPF0386 family)